jgi:hypothetical protein
MRTLNENVKCNKFVEHTRFVISCSATQIDRRSDSRWRTLATALAIFDGLEIVSVALASTVHKLLTFAGSVIVEKAILLSATRSSIGIQGTQGSLSRRSDGSSSQTDRFFFLDTASKTFLFGVEAIGVA